MELQDTQEPLSKRPLVSIVIPVYNGASFLPKAIASCLAQTWSELEVVIVDDGSADNSREVADESARRHAQVRCCHHSTNGGVSVAWNTGFSAAKGEYLLRLAQDDWLEPSAVESLVGTLQANPNADVVYSDYWIIHRNGEQVMKQAPPPEELFKSGNNLGLCVMITKRLWDSGLRYDPNVRAAEDFDFFTRAAKKFTFCRNHGTPLLNFLHHLESGSNRNAPQQEMETAQIKARAATSFWERSKIYNRHFATAAWVQRDRGRPGQALNIALAGLRQAPFHVRLWKEFVAAAGSVLTHRLGCSKPQKVPISDKEPITTHSPSLSQYLQTIPFRFRDAITYSRFLRAAAAQGICASSMLQSGSLWRRFSALARAYRLAQTPSSFRQIARSMAKVIESPPDQPEIETCLKQNRWAESVRKVSTINRSLLLKAPGPSGEKGVLFLHFEYNWLRVLWEIEDLREFSNRYTIVYSTSWSPTDYSLLGLAAAKTDGPIYVQACNYQEIPKLEAFHPRIRCVHGLPCDWLNPEYFTPRPWKDRDIDLLMVSNWAPFKRHWELFATLRSLPAHLRVVCVGQPDERHTISQIKALAKHFGVPQNIEFLESIPIEKVTELQCRSKVAAIFSRWEGCCVAAAEALFAGAVLVMRDNAYVGPRAYVNEQTGLAFNLKNAAAQISRALADGERYRSREWALENISYEKTGQALNQKLKADSLSAGLPWTTDLCAMHWRPYAQLTHERDRTTLRPAWEELHRRYPSVFPESPA